MYRLGFAIRWPQGSKGIWIHHSLSWLHFPFSFYPHEDEAGLVLPDLQVVDDFFDATHLRRKRPDVGPLLGGLDLAGEIKQSHYWFQLPRVS